MKVIYKKADGEIVDFIEGEVKGLNPLFATMEYTGDESETNISEVDDSLALSNMTKLSKLAVLEAMDVLTAERTKFDTLMTDATFKERWQATTELDMTHPLTIAALAQVGFDVNAIKREIIKNS